jgi:mRNA interferase MazF
VRAPLACGEALVADWQAAVLIKTSVPKPVFATMEQRLVIRTMGKRSAPDAKMLREVIGGVIG